MTMSTVGGTICPECSAPVKVRLIGGEACPQCESSKAWERYGGDGHKLVIHKRDIAGAEARITGQADGSAATARYWLPGLLALGVGIGASFFVRELFSARPLGPLEPLVAELQRTSLMSAGLGVVALAVGIASTLAQKKGSLFRNATLLIVNLYAVLVGAFTMLVGAFQWGNWAVRAASAGLTWRCRRSRELCQRRRRSPPKRNPSCRRRRFWSHRMGTETRAECRWDRALSSAATAELHLW